MRARRRWPTLRHRGRGVDSQVRGWLLHGPVGAECNHGHNRRTRRRDAESSNRNTGSIDSQGGFAQTSVLMSTCPRRLRPPVTKTSSRQTYCAIQHHVNPTVTSTYRTLMDHRNTDDGCGDSPTIRKADEIPVSSPPLTGDHWTKWGRLVTAATFPRTRNSLQIKPRKY